MTVWLRSTASTMRDAAALALRGEPHGTVVVAEEQTGGVGRHGHMWHSEHGTGLYLSIILRLPLTPDMLPVLTMALGLAVQSSLDHSAEVSCDLRWPNDVLLNEKKVAGIMVRSADQGALIAGIGVNVNQTMFPADLRSIATSLRIETGLEHSKDSLLDGIVEESLNSAAILVEQGKHEILKRFEMKSSYVHGKAVEVDAGDRIFSGITAGLDEHGFLRVETAAGIEIVFAGGVRAV